MRAWAPAVRSFSQASRDAVARAGDLASVGGVDVRIADRRGHDPDARQVDLEFLGEQRRQRGVHPLPHLRAIDQHGDRIVCADLEPRIQLALRRRRRVAGRAAKRGHVMASTSPPPSTARARGRNRVDRYRPRPRSAGPRSAGRMRRPQPRARRRARGVTRSRQVGAAPARATAPRDVWPCGFADTCRSGKCYRPSRRRCPHRSGRDST